MIGLYETDTLSGPIMILAFVLSRLNRYVAPQARFVWSPALDFQDRAVFSTLLPGAQY